MIDLEEYHGGFKKTDEHPASDFGDPSQFGDLDPEVTSSIKSIHEIGNVNELLFDWIINIFNDQWTYWYQGFCAQKNPDDHSYTVQCSIVFY